MSVNGRVKEGINKILQREKECLTFSWCVAQRLELALKDAFKGMTFNDMLEELLPRLYPIFFQTKTYYECCYFEFLLCLTYYKNNNCSSCLENIIRSLICKKNYNKKHKQTNQKQIHFYLFVAIY